MYVILYIFLAVILLTLLLLLFCLFVPLRYTIEASFEQLPAEIIFTLRNKCYGLKAISRNGKLDWHLTVLGWRIKPKINSSPNNQTSQTTRPQSNKLSRLLWLKQFQNRWLEDYWRLIKMLWPLIRPQDFMLKARIGFDEPHYTGWLMALAGILQGQSRCYDIHLEAVWDEPCLEGQMALAGKIRLAALFGQLLRFILKPEIRSYIKQWRNQSRRTNSQAA